MPVYDSPHNLGSDRDEQEKSLADFESHGGNRAALVAALEQTGQQARRLSREHEAVYAYVAGKSWEDRLRERLARIEKVKRACEDVPLPIPPEIFAEQARVEAEIQRAHAWVSTTDPGRLQEERRATAAGPDQRVQQQIAAPRARMMSLRGMEHALVVTAAPGHR